MRKNCIGNSKYDGCFIHNDGLYIFDTLSNNTGMFKPVCDLLWLFFENNMDSNYVLIDDRGSFWYYTLYKDSVILSSKYICNY